MSPSNDEIDRLVQKIEDYSFNPEGAYLTESDRIALITGESPVTTSTNDIFRRIGENRINGIGKRLRYLLDDIALISRGVEAEDVWAENTQPGIFWKLGSLNRGNLHRENGLGIPIKPYPEPFHEDRLHPQHKIGYDIGTALRFLTKQKNTRLERELLTGFLIGFYGSEQKEPDNTEKIESQLSEIKSHVITRLDDNITLNERMEKVDKQVKSIVVDYFDEMGVNTDHLPEPIFDPLYYHYYLFESSPNSHNIRNIYNIYSNFSEMKDDTLNVFINDVLDTEVDDKIVKDLNKLVTNVDDDIDYISDKNFRGADFKWIFEKIAEEYDDSPVQFSNIDLPKSLHDNNYKAAIRKLSTNTELDVTTEEALTREIRNDRYELTNYGWIVYHTINTYDNSPTWIYETYPPLLGNFGTMLSAGETSSVSPRHENRIKYWVSEIEPRDLKELYDFSSSSDNADREEESD